MIGGLQYATSALLNIPLTSLASSATVGAMSAPIDNRSLLYMDVLLQLRFSVVFGTPSADQTVYVYLYSSNDGIVYTDDIFGVAGSHTFRAPTNLTLAQTISVVATGTANYVGQVLSVAAAFGGIVPPKWGAVVKNTTGLAFAATAGNNQVSYVGLNILNT